MRRVSGDTLRLTTHCGYEFHCLEVSGWDLCPVVRPLNPDGLLLEQCLRANCSYLTSRGSAPLCVCPTRCELFELYQV